MGNPLLTFWYRSDPRSAPTAGRERRPRPDLIPGEVQSAEAVFLVLCRMRAPLIVLIGVFTVSILGLTLIEGRAADGTPERMSVFDAFYFMSYTATTIGFGELPSTFTYTQRMWVTFSIYLTVIGWAYAIGTLLALGQDRAFRQSLAVQGFRRRVRRLREPFLIIAGYGQAGRTVARSLDTLSRRVVVLDMSEERIASLEVDDFRQDVLGLVTDARNPAALGLAGLGHRQCTGVLALTSDDETNLAVVAAVNLLRSDVPVIARAGSVEAAQRMQDFAPEAVVNPDGRFGDYLALSLLQPASYQLMTWLMSPPDTDLPRRPPAPATGRWLVYASGQFGSEMARDLGAVGLDVDVVPPEVGLAAHLAGSTEPGSPSDVAVAPSDVVDAVGLVAGADNDTINLTLIAAARAANPDIFVAARQNLRANAPLLTAIGVDALMVPTDLVAAEAFARLVTPLMWTFLTEVPRRDDPWAASLVARLVAGCGARVPEAWVLDIDRVHAPALVARLAGSQVRVDDLLRDVRDRDLPIAGVPLLLARGDTVHLAPVDDLQIVAGDRILMAGRAPARRSQDIALSDPAALAYVATGEDLPATWLWRAIRGARVPR